MGWVIFYFFKNSHIISKIGGYEVYWPVVCELKWLSEYIPDFNFVSWDDTEVKLTRPPLSDRVQFP